MKRGTIIFVPFPYTDFSNIKNRPAVIISNPHLSSGNIIVTFITSNIDKLLETDVKVFVDHPEFSLTGLSKSSIVRSDKLVTIDRKTEIGEFGEMPESLMKEIDEKLKYALLLN